MTAPAPLEPRKLAGATAGAALVAAVVLVVAVLPAEYGVDPTGIGAWAGFTRLSDDRGDDSSGVDVQPEDDGIDVAHALEVRWEVVEFPVASREGYTEGPFGETRVTLPLNLTNLTTITATLSWNDADLVDGRTTDPDEFEISIRGPGNARSQLVQGENEPGGEGNVSVTLPWRAMPAPTRDAGALVFPVEEPDTGSHGEWTFLVRLYAARGLEGHDAPDPGNNWTLTVTARTYELIVEEHEGASGDRVSITLGPGRGLEYKFQMEPGAALGYAWTSDGPVYWDLHAEEHGHDPEDFTRLAEGTSAGEQGNFTAAFAGRYGWYFQNRGTDPVVISLETSGDYRILGVV